MPALPTGRVSVRSGIPTAFLSLGLTMMLAAQAAAASWNPQIPLTNSNDGEASGLAVLSSSNAVALYTSGPGLFVRRTANGGASWLAKQKLAKYPFYTAIGGAGSDVDVVWTNQGSPGSPNVFIRYRHGTSSGASFGSAVKLASGSYDTDGFNPAVGRGPGGVVAVAWSDFRAAATLVRVSTNGGASFGAVATLGSNSTSYDPPPTVAIVSGVIYVAYFVDDTHVDLRRSLDNGVTWQPAMHLASDAYPNDDLRALSIAASGTHAYIAYAAKSGSQKWVRYRRTIDSGVTWTAVSDLSSASGFKSYHPSIALTNGVVRAVFDACTNASCTTSVVNYRQSSNGTSWTAAQTASHSGPNWADPVGVGFAGDVIVLYDAQHGTNFGQCGCDTYVRTR